MTTVALPVFCFDDVEVDARTAVVCKAGAPLQIEPKSFRLLLFLIENRDRLVEKNELLDCVWKDVAVSENALTQAVARLRKILGDDSKTTRYIQTVHTRGYRFIAAVEEVRNGNRRTVVTELSATAPLSEASPSNASGIRWMRWVLAILTTLTLLTAGMRLRKSIARQPVVLGPSYSLCVLPFV